MGLDIVVIKNIEYINSVYNYTPSVMTYNLKPFDSVFNQSDGLESGMYSGEYINTNISMAYSSYNKWRQILIDFSGNFEIEEIPIIYKRNNNISKIIYNKEEETHMFSEICYFSDCDGFIGPKTSKKLYNDFTNNLYDYIDYIHNNDYDEYNIDIYKEFNNSFKLAFENNGIVLFT